MRALSAAALIAATALSAPALALESPTPIAPDEPRVRIVPYAPDDIIRINAPSHGETAIVLHDGEIRGDKSLPVPGWRMEGQANVLVVAGDDNAPPTDVHVVTATPDGGTHRYTFLLTISPSTILQACGQATQAPAAGMATPADDKARAAEAEARAHAEAVCPYATVRINYSADDAAKAKAAAAATAKADAQARRERWLARRHAAEGAHVRAVLAEDQASARKRCDFKWRGAATLLPTEACDTGQDTLFFWPGQMPVPSISVLDPEGNEQTVSSTADPAHPGLIRVDRTARWWRLRLGRKLVAELYDAAFSDIGTDWGTGTVSPRVRTELRADAGAGQ